MRVLHSRKEWWHIPTTCRWNTHILWFTQPVLLGSWCHPCARHTLGLCGQGWFGVFCGSLRIWGLNCVCGWEKCHPGRIFNLHLSFRDLPISGGTGFCWCMWAFSSCSVWGLLSSYSAQASHCSGFSCWKAWALRCAKFSSCSSQAPEHRL